MDPYEDEAHTLTYSCIMAPNRCTKRLLNMSDTVISLTIVTPLVVIYWSGTWNFMDRHPEYFPALPTFLFGMTWHLLVVLSRQHVHEKMKTPEKVEKNWWHRITKFLFMKIFIYTFSINGIMAFRAGWALTAPYGWFK